MLSQLLSRTVTIRTLLLGALWTLPCVGIGFMAGQHATAHHTTRTRGLQMPAGSAMAVATHPGAVSQSSSANRSDEEVFGRPYGDPKPSASAAPQWEPLNNEPNGAGVETYRMPSAEGKETIVVIIREDGRRAGIPSLK